MAFPPVAIASLLVAVVGIVADLYRDELKRFLKTVFQRTHSAIARFKREGPLDVVRGGQLTTNPCSICGSQPSETIRMSEGNPIDVCPKCLENQVKMKRWRIAAVSEDEGLSPR